MNEAQSPLSIATTWDLVAADYAIEVSPTFELFAERALELAGVRTGSRVVDVAAGPGTLSFLAAKRGAHVSALDFSPAMLDQLKARSLRDGVAIAAREGNGMALPYEEHSFDAGFSMFGLMFFPDRAAGFRELHRVLTPGARAVVSSWQPMEQMPLLYAFVSTLSEILSAYGEPPPPRPLAFPLASIADCQSEMAAAGFHDVTVHEVLGTLHFPSLTELVASFVRSSAPVKLASVRLGERWPETERLLTQKLRDRLGDGAQESVMPAYLTVATR